MLTKADTHLLRKNSYEIVEYALKRLVEKEAFSKKNVTITVEYDHSVHTYGAKFSAEYTEEQLSGSHLIELLLLESIEYILDRIDELSTYRGTDQSHTKLTIIAPYLFTTSSTSAAISMSYTFD